MSAASVAVPADITSGTLWVGHGGFAREHLHSSSRGKTDRLKPWHFVGNYLNGRSCVCVRFFVSPNDISYGNTSQLQ